jgi:hypothetical protein
MCPEFNLWRQGMALDKTLRALGCVALAVALVSTLGCAANKTKTAKAKVVPPSEVKVYQTPDLLQSQYTLIEHVWIDSWRTNVTFPSFKSEADGMDAMKKVASDVGANALINVMCHDTRTDPKKTLNLNCYGDAILVN